MLIGIISPAGKLAFVYQLDPNYILDVLIIVSAIYLNSTLGLY